MNRKDRRIIEEVKVWLASHDEGTQDDEISTSLDDIKYDVENFIKGIRFHTERFQKEIGASEKDNSLKTLEKSQFVSRGEFIKEIKKQVESIETGENLPIAFSILGNSFFFLTEYDLASRCFERSIAYLPIIPSFFNNLGCCYFKRKQWIKAKRAFQKTLDLQPDYRDAEINLQAASLEYSKQKKIDYWVARGNRNFSTSNADEARKCYEKALDAGGQMPEVLVNIGNIYFQAGEDKKAEEFYGKVIQNDADYAPAYASLGKLRLRQDNRKDAFENLQHAFELDSTLHDSLSLMGDISFKWENYPQALELYEAYLNQHPDSITTLLLIGDCYLKMGKTDAAIYAYEAVEKAEPENKLAQERLAYLNKTAS